MNKTLRLLISFVIIVVLFASMANLVFATSNIPNATSEFYVNDFASVFTQEEKDKLIADAVNLSNEHNCIQVVITTIKSLEGDTIENYAYNMYNQYGIGKDDMGLLILVSTGDRQIRVEVGKAMEGYINDAKAGRFIDKYAISYLKENKFNEGLISLQQAFINEIKLSVNSQGEANHAPKVNIDWISILNILVICVILAGIITLVIIMIKKHQAKENQIQQLKDEVSRLSTSINNLKRLNENLCCEKKQLNYEKNELNNKLNEEKHKLKNLEIRHNQILTIYPDADKKVDEMIERQRAIKAKEAAQKVDKLILSVIDLEPNKDLVNKLSNIKYEIDFLTSYEAKYLEADLERFNNLYSKCRLLKKEYENQLKKEKANNITKKLRDIIKQVGIVSASDLHSLRDAKELYEGIDDEIRSYVDSTVINEIEHLFKLAKKAKQQEEEDRRSKNAYVSTNSFKPSIISNNRNNYGGFGGRSGGGGASRGF